MGLSICNGIISKHGGAIWVESELGMGKNFIIELPIVDSDHTVVEPDDRSLAQAGDAGHGPILIIDESRASWRY